MDKTGSHARAEVISPRWGHAAVGAVFVIAATNWVGWAIGIDEFTRVLPSWPHMTPWTAFCLTALGAAIVAQTGRTLRVGVRVGRGLAVLTGVVAVVFLAEDATGGSFGVDLVRFPQAVHAWQASWPGRPSPQTAVSLLLLSIAVALIQADRWRAGRIGRLCMVGAAVAPVISAVAYLFGAVPIHGVTPSSGMGIFTVLGILLLVAATMLARPDRNSLGWLLARPDRRVLTRIVAVLAGLPITVGFSRLALLALGLPESAALALSVTLGTVLVGAFTSHFSQRELQLILERERFGQERAEAEERYRILADNAVDVIVHVRDNKVVWISPSAQAAFGDPPQKWIGADYTGRIHPDDVEHVVDELIRTTLEKPSLARFRVLTADGNYRWIEGHAKPYIDADGSLDGIIASMRVIDGQVEAQRQLERLARYDTLTGLENRAVAIGRLEAALKNPRSPGPELGVLFCDVDHFKEVNDTWGHVVGDLVLTTSATRILESVRHGDTVGRTGGDEILILLPDIHNLDEAVQIAEKIRQRAAEPIDYSGKTIEVTFSIGATLAIPGESVTAATARVDAAMYRAKRAGRNTVTRI